MRSPTQLGARLYEDGALFGVAAPEARAATLCYWEPGHTSHMGEVSAEWKDNGIWQAWLPRARAGLQYAWRLDGPHDPVAGHRFDPQRWLLDPYAACVLPSSDPTQAPRALLIEPLPAPVCHPVRVSPHDRVLCEVHVKGYTQQHPEVPAEHRGRYLGLTHPSVLSHLKSLGITSVSLMPLAARVDELRLQAMGLSNYWGYNPIGWMAPEPRYASSPDLAPRECLQMVHALHEAGLEVIVDVVFNHSAESDETGPTLSLKGLGNRTYYRLEPQDLSRYINWAGCGNVLNMDEPLVLRLILDSLRHWVTTYGVDGFRFDLAPILGRTNAYDHHPHFRSGFFTALAQDPILRDCVLIAEPWDLGPNGYHLGGFPPNWLEWNDQFRDAQRSIWLQRTGSLARLAETLAGSRGYFGSKPAHTSVNFVSAHDGFTLKDLTQYTDKHNEANGEENRDGHNHNHSHNFGVEGPTGNLDIQDHRNRARRSLAAIALLGLGTPMWRGGDELGQSQAGNNNAYCQDSPLTWVDWAPKDREDLRFLAWVQRLAQLRVDLPAVRAHRPWTEQTAEWLQPDGSPMDVEQWHSEALNGLALTLRFPEYPEWIWWGFNPSPHSLNFTLPSGEWTLAADSAHPERDPQLLQHRETIAPGCIMIAYTRIHKH